MRVPCRLLGKCALSCVLLVPVLLSEAKGEGGDGGGFWLFLDSLLGDPYDTESGSQRRFLTRFIPFVVIMGILLVAIALCLGYLCSCICREGNRTADHCQACSGEQIPMHAAYVHTGIPLIPYRPEYCAAAVPLPRAMHGPPSYCTFPVPRQLQVRPTAPPADAP